MILKKIAFWLVVFVVASHISFGYSNATAQDNSKEPEIVSSDKDSTKPKQPVITWPERPKRPGVPGTLLEPEKLQRESGLLENYRQVVESFRVNLEENREKLESLRQANKISREKYLAGIETYKKNIKEYKSSIKDFMLILNNNSEIKAMKESENVERIIH